MMLNCKGKLLELNRPKIMGIINITPDSFYDGGKFNSNHSIIGQIEKMLLDGADIIDVGGQSTKPGADFISEEEELKRVIPVVEMITKEFPQVILSIDTFWSKVAMESIDAGASIINDVSAGKFDSNIIKVATELGVPYVLMHMNKTPKDMQNNLIEEGVIYDMNIFFAQKIIELKALGINDIILDPGIGFGKTLKQNFEIIKNIDKIGCGDYPVLIGVSRKSIVCKTLGVSPKYALNGTTAVHMLALQNGANILRAHDVKEAVECVKLWEEYNKE